MGKVWVEISSIKPRSEQVQSFSTGYLTTKFTPLMKGEAIQILEIQ